MAAAVLGVPSTAVAAEPNVPPLQPLTTDLQTEFRDCGSGEARSYVGRVPVLTAKLYDSAEDDNPASGNSVSAEFEAWWTGSDGDEQRRTYTPVTSGTSGTVQRWQLPADVPADTVVSWRVRANDGQALSPWSDEGAGAACEFVYDNESPEPAVIRSDDFPESTSDDLKKSDGVGVYGTFTMDSPSEDVVAYKYGFIGGPYGTAEAPEPGAPATLRFLPLDSGPESLSVQAVDRSGRLSPTVYYDFWVLRGRAPIAQWTLADAPGSKQAAAGAGPEARAGSGVSFGAAAPEGTGLTSTALLDGSGHGFLTPDLKVIDTARTFAVSGWVRPARTDRVMTVASQDATQGPAFTLGLRPSGGKPVWSFGFGSARATGGAPETGEWAHVLGLYDSETETAQLYVNGKVVGDGVKAEGSATTGTFQIGRARGKNGYRDRWEGEIGDVRAHDRVVVPGEIAESARRKPIERGHWSLETESDGHSPDLHGGEALTLGEGAALYRGPSEVCIPDIDPECTPMPDALVGQGHLDLDGKSGFAATQKEIVDTGDSFSIGVVVQLTDKAPERSMTVLSQGGIYGDAFKVRYQPSAHAWQLVVRHTDTPDAAETVVGQVVADPSSRGHRLAVVYDDASDRMKLFVNGITNSDATATLDNFWTSSSPLTVGRGQTEQGWGEHLLGSVDELHVYSGALDDDDVIGLGFGTDPYLD
ncbi:LamG domain-containing protein [Streptomyces sp. N35]|uniref:LamG domain-containing protein n=1 Tax=Streptomyces sp. N35 TaxID=2795730 RepID=UPI0027DD329D|nr:LamG domain-containing protein [Streptomyces sp. N35]